MNEEWPDIDAKEISRAYIRLSSMVALITFYENGDISIGLEGTDRYGYKLHSSELFEMTITKKDISKLYREFKKLVKEKKDG